MSDPEIANRDEKKADVVLGHDEAELAKMGYRQELKSELLLQV